MTATSPQHPALLRPKAALIAKPFPLGFAYDEQSLAELAEWVDLGPDERRAKEEHQRAVELVLGGWGMPRLDDAFFAAFPEVKVVFYAGGSIRSFMTELAWERGLRITTAAQVNARPVAEFTLAQIILSLKRAWTQSRRCHATRRFARDENEIPGAFGTTVGLLSLGAIGRQVADGLRRFELNVIAYDPLISHETAEALGVTLCSLEEVFERAHVVSCHMPLLPETARLLRREHFVRLRAGATFINTARGAVIAEDEMIAVLQQRPDLTALLDVTDPEPPTADSPLFTLPNVFLTPHISGSIDGECRRMGRFIASEVRRYINGAGLEGEITREQAGILA